MQYNITKKITVQEEVENIRSFFNALEFEETSHTYNVGGKPLTSVSNTIHKYCNEFNTQQAAEMVARKRGLSPEAIIEMWEAKKDYACYKGHQVHTFGENYTFDRNTPHTEIMEFLPYEKAVVKFWNDLPDHIVPAMVELQMYGLDFGIAGTSDILLYDTIRKGFIIADYKTNENLFKNYRKKMKPPFTHLIEMPFTKYQLQLSYYQILFELSGYKVLDRRIVWLLPDGDYKMYQTDDYTQILRKELEDAKQRNNTADTVSVL